MEKAVGYGWLRERYGMRSYYITHLSVIGTRLKQEVDENGDVIETYTPLYTPTDPQDPLQHLEFGLKYDDFNLDFLKAVFAAIPVEAVVAYLTRKPKGGYERRIGYLYEFLRGLTLPVADQGRGNYIDLLDSDRYVTAKGRNIPRWNVKDNLLGSAQFCPVIRRTKTLERLLEADYRQLVTEISQAFPPDIFYRAVTYLYTKETRSSYLIEQEQPSAERTTRFVAMLERAGGEPAAVLMSEKFLTHLQNEIVDARFAAPGFRDFQNYIGQTTLNFKEIVHYICPPPQYLQSIMEGLSISLKTTEGVHPVIRAAIIAFSFVFAHPFEDGNGRLHRFLIHDVLARDQVVPPGMIIPVSAHMINHKKEYDNALEYYSKPLMKKIRYDLQEDHSLTVTNPEAVEGYFRYPDLTTQCIYLATTIQETIKEDIYPEMEFLVKYDEVKAAVQEIVDMPDRYIDLLIKLLHQNKGMLSARKRKNFERLTDDEVSRIEAAFKDIFSLA
jgi:hypothetical protein